MKIKYCGPRNEINVAPFGIHRRDKIKEYPDTAAKELLTTSKKQKFEPAGGKGDKNEGNEADAGKEKEKKKQ